MPQLIVWFLQIAGVLAIYAMIGCTLFYITIYPIYLMARALSERYYAWRTGVNT